MSNGKRTIYTIALAVIIVYIITFVYHRVADTEDTGDAKKDARSICVYEDGSYRLVDVEEYTVYVLAGMMDMSWGEEMLKTMAIIVRTGIYYQMDNQKNDSSMGGDISKGIIYESQLSEVRYSHEELTRLWGNQAEHVTHLAESAVLATHGRVIRFEGKVIMPAYHFVSPGHTVSAEELYGHDIPYLRQVSSDLDRMSDNFSYIGTYSGDRIKKIFGDMAGGKGGLKVKEATKSGYAKTIDVFGKAVDGYIFKEKLNLPSTNIHIDKQEDGYRIITVGVGDALGLSIYGANVLAENNTTCDEIIKYYYTGVNVGP